MANDKEVRSLTVALERREADGGKMTVAGYASVFGERTNIAGMFDEVIEAGAFARSIKSADVRAYFDHDTGRVLGRKSAGSLRMKEDDKGLAVEIDLPDTTDGRDVRTLLERGDVSGMSFGFIPVRQEWDESGEVPLRRILDVDLFEVSIVSEPAYEGTSAALRSLEGVRRERNYLAASKRIARKAAAEAKFRRI